MLYFNSDYVLHELKEMKKSKADDFIISKDIREDLMKNCLEITSIETFFGKFINDIDYYFNSFPLSGRSKEIHQLINEMNKPNFSDYFNFQRNISMDTKMAWDWIDQLMYCLKAHIKKIKNYHQFLNKYNLCKDGLQYIHLVLKSILSDSQNISLKNLKSYLNDCLLIMLNVTDLTEDICQNYQKTIPISCRITDTAAMPARILINCCFDKVELAENETVIVIRKDFKTNLWTVEKTIYNGEEIQKVTLKIPSLFLVLDGFDKEVIDKCTLLRKRVISTWEMLHSEFRKFIFNSILEAVKENKLVQISDTDKSMCYSILDKLVYSLELDNCQSERIFQFRHQLENQRMEDDQYGTEHIDEWNQLENIIQTYNDINLYVIYFKEKLNEFYNQIYYLSSIKDHRYVTMGYFSNINEKQAVQLDLTLRPDKTITMDSDDTLNDPDDFSEYCMTLTKNTEKHDNIDENINNNNNNNNNKNLFSTSSFMSTCHLYFHESSLQSKIQTLTLMKPNQFVAEATTQPQLLSCNFLEIRKVIVCESLLEKQNFKSVIYGLKMENSDQALDIESAVRQELIDLKKENCRGPQNEENIPWKEALKNEELLTFDVEFEMLTLEYIEELLKKYYQSFIGGYKRQKRFKSVIVDEVISCQPISEEDDRKRTLIIGVKKLGEMEKTFSIDEALKRDWIDITNQTYKHNPKNEESELSWEDALDQGLMIGCEAESDMITPEFVKCLVVSKMDENIDLSKLEIVGIVDTSNERTFDKEEAHKLKLLDLTENLFFDMSQKMWLTLKKAIQYGFVLAKKKKVKCLLSRIRVESIKVGEKQIKVNLAKAVEMNVIDQLTNIYTIENLNLEMRFIDAIVCGMIVIGEDKVRIKSDDHVSWLVVQTMDGDPELKDLYQYSPKKEVNLKILSKAQESGCIERFLEMDNIGERLFQSIYLDTLELDPLLCGTKNKKSVLLGCVKEEVSLEKLASLLLNIKDMFAGEMIEGLELLEDKESILSKAKECNIIDKSSEILVIDKDSFSITSLNQLKLWNENNLCFTKIDPKTLIGKLGQLRCLESCEFDTTQNVLLNTEEHFHKGFEMSIFEAVINDRFDFDVMEITDGNSNEMCSLVDSVERGLIDVKTAEDLLDAIDLLSFDKLIDQEIYDPKTNRFKSETGYLGTDLEFDNKLLFKPELAFLCWENDKLINLEGLIKCGILNPFTNEIKIVEAANVNHYVDEKEDERIKIIPLSEAINTEKGILLPNINCNERKKRLPRKLKDLLASAIIDINRDDIIYEGFGVDVIPIKDALEQSLLCKDSLVKLIQEKKEDKDNEEKEEEKKHIIYCGNIEITNLLTGLNLQMSILDNSLSEMNNEEKTASLMETECLKGSVHLAVKEACDILVKVDESLLQFKEHGSNIDSEEMYGLLEMKRDQFRNLLDQVLENISKLNSKSISSLKEYIKSSNCKLNNTDKEIKDIFNKNVKEMSLEQMMESCQTLKDHRLDLSIWLDSFEKLTEELEKIEKEKTLSEDVFLFEPSKDIKDDLQGLRKLYNVVDAEIDPLLFSMEELLNNYTVVEKSVDVLKFEYSELAVSINDKVDNLELIEEKLEEHSLDLCGYRDKLNDLEFKLVEINNLIGIDYEDFQLFLPFKTDLEKSVHVNNDLQETLETKQSVVKHIKEELGSILEKSEEFNEKSNDLNAKLNLIKTQEKTDKTVQETMELKKRLMDIIEDFDPLKMSIENYANNPTFQRKSRILEIYNNIGETQKDLYGKVNEEMVHQVEFKINILSLELEKIQLFAMNLPKSLSTNMKDIAIKLKEIEAFKKNLNTVGCDMQEVDKVLSEDLSDQLEIDFELLEKAFKSIQCYEKERLFTISELDKIYDIISNNYLPTLINFESNKQITENFIRETSEKVENHIIEFPIIEDDKKDSEKKGDNENQYKIYLLKEKKASFQKMENLLVEIEPIMETVELYGFDMIEQLIDLTSDYGYECSLLQQAIQNDIHDVKENFKNLKNKILEHGSKMTNMLSSDSKSIYETLAIEYESWRSLNDILNRLDPIQSNPDKLNKQSEETKFLLDQIKKKEASFQIVKDTIDKLISDNQNCSESQEDITELIDEMLVDQDNLLSPDVQELSDSLKSLKSLIDSIFHKIEQRNAIINDLKPVASEFWPEISDINKSIIKIQKEAMSLEVFPINKEEKLLKIDQQMSIQSDSVSTLTEVDNSTDPECEDKFEEILEFDYSLNTIKEKELNVIRQELVEKQYLNLKDMESDLKDCVEKILQELQPRANLITSIGKQSCELELQEYMETTWEEVAVTKDILEEKEIVLNKALFVVGLLSTEIKKIFDWLEKSEKHLEEVVNITPDQKMIEMNILDLKTLNEEIFSKSLQIDTIITAINEVLRYPHVPNHAKLKDIKASIHQKYENLIRNVMDKHNELQRKYVDIGKIDLALDDNIGLLQEFENQMKNLSPQSCKGDPEFTYSCYKKMKLLSNSFIEMQPIIKILENKISDYGDFEDETNLRCRGTLSIFGKLKEIKELTDQINQIIPEKAVMIQEILKDEKLISKDLLSHIDYLIKVNMFLKQPPSIGFNQSSVDQCNKTLLNYIHDLGDRKNSIESTLKQANNLIQNCVYEKCTFLTTAIKTLSHKFKRCQNLSEKRREQLKDYSGVILEFDREKQNLLKSILELEGISVIKLSPSKITSICAEQIKLIKNNLQKADKCLDTFENISVRSLEIRCFGTRIDNSQLNFDLKEYGLKLAKIQKCLRNRLRIFNQAYKEDKLFTDSYAKLNIWLDESYNTLESFKDDQLRIVEHLDKLKNLCNQLSAQYANFHCTIRYGTYLKDRCVADDPEKAILNDMLIRLKTMWNKIRILMVTEKMTVSKKLIETGNIYDSMKCVHYWIKDSVEKFKPELNLYGDIDTVEVLIDECKVAEQEAKNHDKNFHRLKKKMIEEIKDYDESEIRESMKDIEEEFSTFAQNVKQRSESLEKAMELAKKFNSKLEELRAWFRKSEKLLKMKSLPKFQNETELIELIKRHEDFLKTQNEMKSIMNQFNILGNEILSSCHPIARNYMNRVIFSTGNRWNQMIQRSRDRTKKLNEAQKTLRGSSALIEDLIFKISEHINKMETEMTDELPDDISQVSELSSRQKAFNDGLEEMESQIKTLINNFKAQYLTANNNQPKKMHTRISYMRNIWKGSRSSLDRSCDDLTGNSRLNFLNNQFNKLWKMSVTRKDLLRKHLMELNEKEQLLKFDFQTWKTDFLGFIKLKGLRLNDLFRRQQAIKPGYHNLNEFVSCISRSGFPVNKSVLEEVFNMFNKAHKNEISYQDFIDSMKPDRRVTPVDKSVDPNDKKSITVIIHDIIEREVAECRCKDRFRVVNEGNNKYRLGHNNKLYMVRYLNSTVMVRIGGGWQTITEFLKKNDPCRVEKLSQSDGRKSKTLKSPTPFGNNTGMIVVKPKSDNKSPNNNNIHQHQPNSSSLSKIPFSNISRSSK